MRLSGCFLIASGSPYESPREDYLACGLVLLFSAIRVRAVEDEISPLQAFRDIGWWDCARLILTWPHIAYLFSRNIAIGAKEFGRAYHRRGAITFATENGHRVRRRPSLEELEWPDVQAAFAKRAEIEAHDLKFQSLTLLPLLYVVALLIANGVVG